MRLNRLEKPEPWSDFMQSQLRHAIDTNRLQQYPNYPPFYDKLSRHFRVDRDRLVIGAGIEEFVRSLFMIVRGKVAMLWPTCAMFELYARIFDAPVQRIVTDPRLDLTADEVAAQLDPDVKLLLLANPGQPVDTCFDVDGLRKLAERTAEIGAVFAIDEAYYGFGAPTGMPLTEEFDHVTVLRTFSKAWGAASIRLGWAVSSPRIHRALDGVRQSGEVSSVSMEIASVLMENSHLVDAAIEHTMAGREWLRESVNRLPGMSARGWYANHVLIELFSEEVRDEVRETLRRRAVLVKADYPAPLDRHLLVTCGSRALMEEFFKELIAI